MNLEELRAFCLSLPGTEEDIKWGNNLCFTLAGKIYCIADLEPPDHVSFKVSADEFEELTQTPGIIPAPYLARAKWITIKERSRLGRKDWERYIRQSYELIKAKLPLKLRKSLG